jgi:hypothetical protein
MINGSRVHLLSSLFFTICTIAICKRTAIGFSINQVKLVLNFKIQHPYFNVFINLQTYIVSISNALPFISMHVGLFISVSINCFSFECFIIHIHCMLDLSFCWFQLLKFNSGVGGLYLSVFSEPELIKDGGERVEQRTSVSCDVLQLQRPRAVRCVYHLDC